MNNWQTPAYGVGYAVATSPLGPFKKYVGNVFNLRRHRLELVTQRVRVMVRR